MALSRWCELLLSCDVKIFIYFLERTIILVTGRLIF